MKTWTRRALFIGTLAVIASCFLLVTGIRDSEAFHNPENATYNDLRDWKWVTLEEIDLLQFEYPLAGGGVWQISYEISYGAVVTQNRNLTYNVAHFLFLRVVSSRYISDLTAYLNYSLDFAAGRVAHSLTGVKVDTSVSGQYHPVYRYYMGTTPNMLTFPGRFTVTVTYGLESSRFEETFSYSGEILISRSATDGRTSFWAVYSAGAVMMLSWELASIGEVGKKRKTRKPEGRKTKKTPTKVQTTRKRATRMPPPPPKDDTIPMKRKYREFCPECGERNLKDAPRCAHCGTRIPL